MKKKVLVLSCGTGGGHNSAARAIQESLSEKGIEVDFVEYLEIVNTKIKNKVNDLYIKSTRGTGKIFKQVYRLGKIYSKTRLKSPVYALNSLSKKKLLKYIEDNGYNYIVTTHLFAAQTLTSIKKTHQIHFIAIATDYVCIPFWEETNPDYFIIPHKELEEDFLYKGIEKSKLLPLGIPVSKKFNKIYNKDECKEKLGLEKDKNYILILTGSMGFGNISKMLEILLKNIKDVTFIVSCGNNKKLFNELNNTYNDNTIIIPYTNRINEYIASSEIVLTKPGGLTSTEIATMRKPFIHTMPIPGCENDNANFFDSRKMSIKCNTIEEVVKNTKELLQNKKIQEEMINNQKKYIDINACNKITNFIIDELIAIQGEKHE